MTTTAIADFTTASKPFQISILPASPKVGDAISISITSQDDWVVQSVYGALSNKKLISPKSYVEKFDLGGSSAISLTAPVDKINSSIAETHIVDANSEAIIGSAGSGMLSKVSSKNGAAFIDEEGLYGTLKIEYVSYRSLSWVHDAFVAAGQYILFAKNLVDNSVEKILISVSDSSTNEASVPSLVTIHAKDFCTDLPVPDAGIYINNEYKGVVDSNGKLVIGVLNPGTYSLKIQASNYEDTDADDLANESFTI